MGARTDCGATTSKNGMVLASEVRRIRLRLRNTSQRRTNRLRFQNRRKPRTAGLCGREAAATGHLSLSCTFFRTGRQSQKSGQKVMKFEASNGRPTAIRRFGFHRPLSSALNGFKQHWGVAGILPISKIAHSGLCGQTGRSYDEGGLVPQLAPHAVETLRGQTSAKLIIPRFRGERAPHLN